MHNWILVSKVLPEYEYPKNLLFASELGAKKFHRDCLYDTDDPAHLIPVRDAIRINEKLLQAKDLAPEQREQRLKLAEELRKKLD